MPAQYSEGVRNAQLNAKATEWGASPILRIFTGSKPANCAAASTGSQLVSMTLPASPLAAASGGSIAKAGTWQGTGGAAGTAGYYRIFKSDGTTCVEQDDIGGAMTIDNTSIAIGQTVTVTSYSTTAGNS